MGAEEVESPRLVYVLEYYHKYGTDLSAYESAEDARTSMFEIVAEWADEVLERRGKSDEFVQDFKKKLKDKDSEVLELWYDMTEESLCVHCLPMQSAKKPEEKKDG